MINVSLQANEIYKFYIYVCNLKQITFFFIYYNFAIILLYFSSFASYVSFVSFFFLLSFFHNFLITFLHFYSLHIASGDRFKDLR